MDSLVETMAFGLKPQGRMAGFAIDLAGSRHGGQFEFRSLRLQRGWDAFQLLSAADYAASLLFRT